MNKNLPLLKFKGIISTVLFSNFSFIVCGLALRMSLKALLSNQGTLTQWNKILMSSEIKLALSNKKTLTCLNHSLFLTHGTLLLCLEISQMLCFVTDSLITV